MSLLTQLNNDLKEAMKSGDKIKKSVVQMVKSEVQNQAIDLKRELTDDEIITVVTRKVKQTKDVITEFEKAGRQDLIDASNLEIKVLQSYLPQQLTYDEIVGLVNAVSVSIGATTKAHKGKLMKELQPLTKGKADGKVVNSVVDEVLA